MKYEALGENVLIKIPKEERAYNEIGVANANEKYAKIKIGVLISKGSRVPEYMELFNKYAITEYLGNEIPSEEDKLILINYNHVGAKVKE
jgi:co-chaperonin GroES (HSP10)